MDPVTLILTALAVGAALGVKDTASAAVKDAYQGLKALVNKRFAGRRDGALVLARYEEAPDTWKGPLTAELTAVGVAGDESLVTAAQALMQLVDAAGSAAGKYQVSAADHSAAAGRDMTITASGGGTAAGVIHGNVGSANPTPPGPAPQ